MARYDLLKEMSGCAMKYKNLNATGLEEQKENSGKGLHIVKTWQIMMSAKNKNFHVSVGPASPWPPSLAFFNLSRYSNSLRRLSIA
mmetsp:Transcript_7197/g.7177  ORF Transcript_7197/g.7177 Transcript_7197/m.7177 type:complete len:86 (-) Transcript_7197:460-717(-)